MVAQEITKTMRRKIIGRIIEITKFIENWNIFNVKYNIKDEIRIE